MKKADGTLMAGEVDATGRIGIWVERADYHDVVAKNLGFRDRSLQLVNHEISI
jgi:hypothetical protein